LAYAYVEGDPLNEVDPLGLCGWRDPWNCVDDAAEAVVETADDAWDATGGKAVSYVDDHKVGVLKGTSWVLAGSAIVAAPFTGGTSLSTLPVWLAVASGGTAVAAEALDPKPGRAQRVTFAVGATVLGGSVGAAFGEGGLALFSVATDAGLLAYDIFSSGASGSGSGYACNGGASW
jgi:hypothetical protein